MYNSQKASTKWISPRSPTSPPYIPLEEVEAGVEVEDPREENFKQETTLTIPKTEERGRGGFRGKPRGGKFDRSPTKRVPRENSKTKDSDKDRCRYCREIGHWVKDCPQKQKEMAKKDTESAFSGLNEIAQDFYADRTTEVFHGITEDYIESGEEETLEDNGMEPQNQIDHLN